MRSELRGLCGALLVYSCLFSADVPAQWAGTVRIIGIAPTTGVTRVATSLQTASGLRLPKFRAEDVAVPAAVLAVTWDQVPGLAPNGADLRLDYRMDGQPATHTLRHALPPRERGPLTHRFEIPLVRDAGLRVSAWRLRLMHDNTVLEEYTSAAWR